ncbi:subtilisin-like protease 4 [Triticum dicoccoides]|uniref:subtilisin-like protease 4 n=1 Tax=Triticum dicoccoides TaxID=85692 RepID=UPI0018902E50|nr:subtilisin-like protease 4 [Triticum dicoccoides]
MRTLVAVAVLLLVAQLLGACHGQEQRKNYVVHLEPRDDEGSAAVPVEDWHRSFLPEAAPSSAGDGGADAGPRIIYSYSHVLTGFAARLSDAEADALRGRPGCIRLYPEVFLPLATTHSPGFLGLQTGKDGFWSRSGFGRGVVIGLVDTGILPSHPSFGDAGMPPPPKKWKGACEFKAIAGAGGCNNKVIGARAFGSAAVNDTAPPVDDAGHGTHTASTAAGNFVENADVRGNAHGTASGMAPHAHLAIYKVCSRSRCSIMDVIAGLDAAVKDGVDVISMSIDVSDGAQFNYDLVAVATYKAIERGIFVSAAAGNAGPAAGSVSNCAPWMLTVAAGTTDRAIRTTVKLGNGQEFDGESLFQPHNNSAGRPLPLVFPGASGDPDARGCSSLPDSVSGKVVLCESRGFKEHVEQGQTVKAYSGAGMILMNKPEEGYTTFANAHVLPASHVSNAAGSKITAYFTSTPNPTASITFKGTVLGISPAPTVAFFSSRGPSKASPGILKPDISGPGMNILAAWAPSEMHPEFVDDVSLAFFMESGTSMSTPHLSGIAAVIKSLHPSWSPAAIKSALMTSSDPADKAGVPVKDEQYRRASFFTMGAGYVNPSRAVDPGLVYDLSPNDYIPYLCGLGYGDDGVKEIVHRRVDCAKLRPITEAELNYPSLVVKLLSQPITVRRTVKNVGKANSVYTAVVDMPKEVSVTVRPPMLRFSKVNERQSFTVTVRWAGTQPAVAGAEGNLKWVSPEHVVRSPIVVPPAKVAV